MIYLDLYLIDDKEQVIAELGKNVKYNVLPNKDDNLVFNDIKYEISRIIHNIKTGPQNVNNKVILMLKQHLKEKTKQLPIENKANNKNEFYIL